MALPACGIYRTTQPIGSIPAGRLVMFHNHGEPGPGVYLPERWQNNRARFSKSGLTLADLALADTLDPLAPEGLYRVEEPFTCCAKQCRRFEQGQLVQLGYDLEGQPIVFVPEWTEAGLAFPALGQRLDAERLSKLSRLRVAEGRDAPAGAYH